MLTNRLNINNCTLINNIQNNIIFNQQNTIQLNKLITKQLEIKPNNHFKLSNN